MAKMEMTATPARAAAAYPAIEPTLGPLSAAAESEGVAEDEVEERLEDLVVRVTVNC